MRLALHVRACVDGDWLIFLDLAHNRYLAADSALADALDDFAPSESKAGEAKVHETTPSQARTLDDLSVRGLIETSAPKPEPIARKRIRKAEIAAPAALQFLCAAHWARSVVRRGALQEAVEAISCWKTCAATNAAPQSALLFSDLRLWHPAKYVCLFDSLCLLRFLMARGEGAEFVIGVRARPFFAHAWLEHAGEIIDDGGEDCRSTKEILRV